MSTSRRPDPPPWLPCLGDALVEALPRLWGQSADPPLKDLLLALTRALERGELAIDLEGPAPEGLQAPGWPEAHRQALDDSPLARDPHGPLAVEGRLVGWRRWRRLRARVLASLAERAGRRHPPTDWLPPPQLRDPEQQRAIRTALEHDLLVLVGGPGTGKTSTVAHLLAALAERSAGSVIQLAAPTGKAAARLRLATGGRWPCGTLHQLLESSGEGDFRRHRQRPLRLDVLVVDEVSMVDLALMAALLDALPDGARLVLVGDPAQLPPVAPGAPLREWLAEEAGRTLVSTTVTLRTVYRNAGAIATVAAALREWMDTDPDDLPDPIGLLRPLLSGLAPEANLRWWEAPPDRLPEQVRQRLRAHLRRLATAARACAPGDGAGWRELLAIRDQLLLLSPRYRGPWGVDGVHRQLLGDPSTTGLGQWPAGTPVLCRRNLPSLGLSNGDLGVVVVHQETWLLFGQEEPIWVHPAQVGGAIEPAIALTVHKAQGSEAESVIVLAPGPDPTEPHLLYTALTRARQEAWLFTPSAAANPVGTSSRDGAPAAEDA